MAYTISSALAIYFVLWWVVLFLTLPFGVRSQSEGEETVSGTEPGAPITPRMGRRILWTTIITAVVYGVAAYLHSVGIFTIEYLSRLMGLPV